MLVHLFVLQLLCIHAWIVITAAILGQWYGSTLKWKCHFYYFPVTDCTKSCHFDFHINTAHLKKVCTQVHALLCFIVVWSWLILLISFKASSWHWGNALLKQQWRIWVNALQVSIHYMHMILMVSCQNGPTRHAYAWQIGPFWQDTLDIAKINLTML